MSMQKHYMRRVVLPHHSRQRGLRKGHMKGALLENADCYLRRTTNFPETTQLT